MLSFLLQSVGFNILEAAQNNAVAVKKKNNGRTRKRPESWSEKEKLKAIRYKNPLQRHKQQVSRHTSQVLDLN